MKEVTLNQSEKPLVETPCQQNVDVFDSRYLEDFDAREYQEENSEIKHTEDSLLQAEVRHGIIQQNAVIRAKDLCSECPILADCLRWVTSVENSEYLVYGVVAGLTQKERIRERKRMK